MAFELDFPTRGTQLALVDGFAIDCLLSDNHTFEADITEFPVESGSTISDNIRNKPLVVAMECLISNTPLEFAGSLRKAGSNPANDAYDLMLGIRRDHRLVTITTSLQTYANMALQSLSIPRASGRADGLLFNATFKQVEIVTVKREARTVPRARGGGELLLTPTADSSTLYAYVDFSDNTWYDTSINAWRHSVRLDTNPMFGHGFNPLTFGKFVLREDRPTQPAIPPNVWNNETVGQHRSSILRPRLLALQGGKIQNNMNGRNPNTVKLLPASSVVVVRLLPL